MPVNGYFQPGLIKTAIGTLIAGLLLAGVAQALTGARFRYQAPQRGFLMLPAAAFAPAAGTQVFVNLGLSLEMVGTGDACFVAPINLPQDAALSTMHVWYRRPAPSDMMKVYAQRVRLPGNIDDEYLANIHVANAPISVENNMMTYRVPTSRRVIKNQTYAYFARMCMEGNSRFFGARIDYTYQKAGD